MRDLTVNQGCEVEKLKNRITDTEAELERALTSTQTCKQLYHNEQEKLKRFNEKY